MIEQLSLICRLHSSLATSFIFHTLLFHYVDVIAVSCNKLITYVEALSYFLYQQTRETEENKTTATTTTTKKEQLNGTTCTDIENITWKKANDS